MEQARYQEMLENFERQKNALRQKLVYLFGHCEATLTLADLLLENGIRPVAILDNSQLKQGQTYQGIMVVPPQMVLKAKDSQMEESKVQDSQTLEPKTQDSQTVVLIVTRFYEAMNRQLRQLGYRGEVVKLVDYNTFAAYSLSNKTQEKMRERLQLGQELLGELKEQFGNAFLVVCPFNALGDIYFCLSYLPAYMKKRGIKKYAVCVPSQGCLAVARLFGIEHAISLEQKKLDAVVQAVIYTQDNGCFIAHQDRPYVVDLHRVLKMRQISLETIYCCGIFGLAVGTPPMLPTGFQMWEKLDEIEAGKAVILAPYAKSVPALPESLWEEIVEDFLGKGLQVYTNVTGLELPLPHTLPLQAELCEMRSIVEKAGTFIGIRSGLCDVLRTAECRKVALYPDYYYCDTKWKAVDMYRIEGYENIVVKEGFRWKTD